METDTERALGGKLVPRVPPNGDQGSDIAAKGAAFSLNGNYFPRYSFIRKYFTRVKRAFYPGLVTVRKHFSTFSTT
jgi:hypothetical protein